MKKRSLSSVTKWHHCGENFSDFLKQTTTERKVRRKSRSRDTSKQLPGSYCKSECTTSQDGSINWSSSEEETFMPNDQKQSPVICGSSSKQFIAMGGGYVKSTPAGSPILSQRHQSTVEKKLKPRRFSLLPISPISSVQLQACLYSIKQHHDIPTNATVSNVSYFSLHAYEESEIKEATLDRTPLAVPLSESEDEDHVESFDQTLHSYDEQTQDVIEVLTTQTSGTPHCSTDIAGEENSEVISTPGSPSDHFLSENAGKDEGLATSSCVKGSAWIESMMGKLDDGTRETSPKKIGLAGATQYDSGKKKKFIQNGMAEQLNRVIRQQQTQKVLFKHQMRRLNDSDAEVFQRSMKLKVISHHRDGMLHVMECKVVAVGKKCGQKRDFLTLILNHEDVSENRIDLMTTLTIFPPWKEVHLQQHNFPVLICVYHIQVDRSETASTSASQATTLNATPPQTTDKAIKGVGSRQDCENLLEALERQDTINGICLAATAQRTYSTTACNTTSWNCLCEDAYGVFFELTLDESISSEENWSWFIKHGEGHRLYFERLFLKGRTTRKQAPLLFSLIDSSWNPDGFGLLQVQNSQSQESEDKEVLENSSLLQPPNFCYKLAAARWQSKCYFSATEQDIFTASKLAHTGLNRPNMKGLTSTDVLYRSPIRINCSNVLSQAAMHHGVSRFSLLGKVFHQYCPKHSAFPDSNIQNINFIRERRVFIVDETSSHVMDIVSVVMKDDEDVVLHSGDFVLLKNIYLRSDGDFIADSYSQVIVLETANNNTVDQCLLDCSSFDSVMFELRRFSNVDIPLLNRCRQANIAELPALKLADKAGIFVVDGVICGLASAESYHVLSSQHQPLSRDENFLRLLTSQESTTIPTSLEDSIEILVVVQLTFKVRLKILQRTAWKLASQVESHKKINSSSLNGRRTGALRCFVYARFASPLQTMFFAEEINVA